MVNHGSEVTHIPESSRQPEERYQHLIESTEEYAFIFMDVEGTIEAWNAGARLMFGHLPEEAIGQHFGLIFVPEDREIGMPARELATAASTGKAVDERWHLKQDGSRLWASGFTVPLKSRSGRIEGFAKIAQDATARKMEQMEREALLVQVQDALHIANREHQAAELARAEAEAAQRAADAANEFKDEFIHQVAHELRSPLDAVLLWTHLLENNPVSAEDTAKGLSAIGRGARSIQSLLDDLLDSVRGRTGKIALETESLDLAALVRQSVGDIRPSANSKGLTLDVLIPEGQYEIWGDARRLHQVLANLLANAIKFTSAGGRIQVELRSAPQEITLTVDDTGIGFSPEFGADIFEPYRQGEAAKDAPGGLGLGLYIVRNLVELHGGSVQAQSRGIGYGARFEIRLPRRN